MDGHKTEILLALLVGLTAISTGLNFKVEVAPDPDISTSMFNYSEKVRTGQNFSAWIYNDGSTGCRYRMKAVYKENNLSKVFYSSPESLYPGMQKEIGLQTVPGKENTTRKGEIFIEYCGEESLIGNFSYNQTEKIKNRKEKIDTKTVNTNHTSIEVVSDVKSGYLVPKDVPTYWKVSHAYINDGSATIHYEPPLLNSQREMEFYVYSREKNEMIGTTKIMPEEQFIPGKWLKNNYPALLLVLSISLNLLLYRKLVKKGENDIKF